MNIKIGKGGSGSINSTKGGSGKVNEKKYIDLLPTNFISKVTLSGGTYSNGTYTRNSGGTTTFDGPDGKTIFWDSSVWMISDPAVPAIYTYYSTDLINWTENEANGAPTGVTENALSFLFDPIFYKNEIEEGIVDSVQLDPAYLKQLRNYQIDSTIPNLGFNPTTWQRIIGAARGTKKAIIKNNTLSYIKYSDNSDVEEKKLNRFYDNVSSTQFYYNINPPIDNRKPLLLTTRNDYQPFIFKGSNVQNSTLNMFIRLQRPIQHKNPNTGYIVREKRGIFCGAYNFRLGYRCPYYNITGRPSYKGVFNNFSFVFSFGAAGYQSPFNRPISVNLMTDYKFNFGEMYMLSMVWTVGEGWRIYVNGELQTVALVPFNPLVNPVNKIQGPYRITLSGGTYNNGTYEGGLGSTVLNGPDGKYIELNPSAPLSAGGPYESDNMYSFDPAHPDFPNAIYTSVDGGVSWFDNGTSSNPGTPPNGIIDATLEFKKLYKTRRDEMPLGPGFYKKDGTIYPYTNTVYNIYGTSNDEYYLIFGRSSLNPPRYPFSKKMKRYLNNLDIGVISSYNVALSQSQISEMYNNFRYRYI